MCNVQLPPGVNPIAVNKYIISCIISYHITYHIISYHIISYHIISYHIISYIISYHIISYHIISYHIISYHIISYHISYHIIKRVSGWSRNSSTMEHDRLQKDSTETWVIVQQYSSTSFVSFRFNSRKRKIRLAFQIFFHILTFSIVQVWNCFTWNSLKPGSVWRTYLCLCEFIFNRIRNWDSGYRLTWLSYKIVLK